MRNSKGYIITLGECINEIASHNTEEWYEVMDIQIDGLREAFARAEANAITDENEDFWEPIQIEAQYIRAHQHDLYLVQKPDGYGPTQYIKQGANAVHCLVRTVSATQSPKNENSMDVLFIKREQPEWNYMWNLMAKHRLNEGLEEPTVAHFNYEGWQYMDTSVYDGQLAHCFRHRCHPKTQRREYLRLSVSDSLKMLIAAKGVHLESIGYAFLGADEAERLYPDGSQDLDRADARWYPNAALIATLAELNVHVVNTETLPSVTLYARLIDALDDVMPDLPPSDGVVEYLDMAPPR